MPPGAGGRRSWLDGWLDGWTWASRRSRVGSSTIERRRSSVDPQGESPRRRSRRSHDENEAIRPGKPPDPRTCGRRRRQSAGSGEAWSATPIVRPPTPDLLRVLRGPGGRPRASSETADRSPETSRKRGHPRSSPGSAATSLALRGKSSHRCRLELASIRAVWGPVPSMERRPSTRTRRAPPDARARRTSRRSRPSTQGPRAAGVGRGTRVRGGGIAARRRDAGFSRGWDG